MGAWQRPPNNPCEGYSACQTLPDPDDSYDGMASIVMEEYELLGDAKYRSYMSLVDKALKGFEYTTEWADLIAALGKLNKVLLAHTK